MAKDVARIAEQPDRPSSRPKNIPLSSIISYAEQGLSLVDIGKLLGCSHQVISARMARAGYTPTSRRNYERDKALVLEVIQMQIVQSLQACNWDKISPSQKVTALAILEDKIRLIRGQSTHNIQALTALIASIHCNQTDNQPETDAPDVIDVPTTIPEHPVQPDDKANI